VRANGGYKRHHRNCDVNLKQFGAMCVNGGKNGNHVNIDVNLKQAAVQKARKARKQTCLRRQRMTKHSGESVAIIFITLFTEIFAQWRQNARIFCAVTTKCALKVM
jgi:hypothetical protein